jgi:hypothetical protein
MTSELLAIARVLYEMTAATDPNAARTYAARLAKSNVELELDLQRAMSPAPGDDLIDAQAKALVTALDAGEVADFYGIAIQPKGDDA